ncbi:hypothetical protein B0H34DRAFT_779734 [Crassisporium funariophilum]|nr:hypothetical protein B0H34DRAFT_779734 [Crassisporium funariophilum]
MSDIQGLLPLLASARQPPVTFAQLVLLVQPGSFQLVGNLCPILPPSIQEFISAASVPVWPVHLVCCNVNYHHNYRVFNGQRIYYDGIPELLQIGEHQFAELKLVRMWIMMMLLSWTSATNCACIYNLGFSGHNVKPPSWQFKLETTSDQFYNAFTILSLLEDCQFQRATLVVPHGGPANECFTEAKSNTLVIDVSNCKILIRNNHDCFCPAYSHMRGICAIVNCSLPVASEPPGKKTCSLPKHEAIEKVHNSRGQACFQLKERQCRAQVAHPCDALPVEVTDISELVKDGDVMDDFEFNCKGLPIPVLDSAPTAKKTLRAQFGRKQTHNEQLFVAPCGMIIARETFYHAEAIYSVIEMIKRVYRIPGTKPNHIFFNNNCTLGKAVKNDPFFKDIALTVDVFHFKCKHSEKDQFCQDNCNPVAYPELLGEDDKQWYFNSSAICREMRVDRYNFFFDEMIRRRNIMTLARLTKEEGTNPGTWPFPT